MLHSTPIPDRERSTLVQSITINGPNPRRYPKWREFPIETINHPPSIIAEWLAMIGDHFELGCCNCASKRPQLAPHRWSAGVARVPGGHPDSRVTHLFQKFQQEIAPTKGAIKWTIPKTQTDLAFLQDNSASPATKSRLGNRSKGTGPDLDQINHNNKIYVPCVVGLRVCSTDNDRVVMSTQFDIAAPRRGLRIVAGTVATPSHRRTRVDSNYTDKNI